jgi:putative pyruvate formate lyase activating enzyme
MASLYPSYLSLFESGELARRADEAVGTLTRCRLCPRQCNADRINGSEAKPYCRIGRYALVSSAFPHHGEEACLRGVHGSGTIFFCNCNLRCVFCQNFDISWQAHGREMVAEQIADLMLDLQDRGCHNINFVTPTHVVPQILEALVIAAGEGLSLPLVYNSGGYDSVETLRLLDGVIDIYMPDFKFWDPAVSQQLANAENYGKMARAALKEMHRQVGDLVLDNQGLARRGLLVRHLVLPDGQAGTSQVARFLAREISPDTFINIMAQYHPAGHAGCYPAIDRRITTAEYVDALRMAREEGLHRFDNE